MRLAPKKIMTVLAGFFLTSALVAAETKEAAKPGGKGSRKGKSEPTSSTKAAPSPATSPGIAKSATPEGVLIFESLNTKRPRVALTFQESNDFKNIPNLMNIKTPEPPPQPEKPRNPAADPVNTAPTEKGPPADAPVSRIKTPADIEAQKAENAAAEAAELPVDIGPFE